MFVLLLLLAVLQTSKGLEDMCSRCSCKGGTVDCRDGRIEGRLNETIWEGIISVEEILLDSNRLVRLERFPAFGSKKLSLRHDSISVIDDSAFLLVSGLKELDLSYNQLTSHSLTPHAFRGGYAPDSYQPLKELTTLRLSGNLLHSLRADVFEHLPALRRLYLDSNPFKIIDIPTAAALSSVNLLEVLDLSSAMLSNFPSSILHTPKFLKVLNFSSNHMTEIPQALEEAHSLEEFIIDDNFIIHLRRFPEVSTLKVLRINWMPSLRSIEREALSNLSRLEVLQCTNNRHLSEISEDAFRRPPSGEEETSSWPLLRKLYLSNNDLSYLGVDLLSRWDRLEEIDIQGNPWVCDCENQWFMTTLIPRINRTNPELTRQILCAEPPELLDVGMYDLAVLHTHMRCLDMYGNQPEKDGPLLVGIFISVLILIPIATAALVILSIRLRKQILVSYKHITPSQEM